MATLFTYQPATPNAFGITATSFWGLQFEFAVDCLITSVQIYTRALNEGSTGEIRLYSTTGADHLPNTLLGTIEIDGALWGATPQQRTFTFDSPIEAPAAWYAIVMYSDSTDEYHTISWPMSSATLGSGRIHTVNGGSSWVKTSPSIGLKLDVYGDVSGPSEPEKATNPTPAHSTNPGTDFSDYTLTWENGGGATSYNLRATDWEGLSGPIVSGLTDPTYTFPVGSWYRRATTTTTFGWRVDSVNEYGTTIGDTWTFDPRPAKVTNPYPADMATEVGLNIEGISWTASELADDYNVYFSGSHPLEDDWWTIGYEGVAISDIGQPLFQSTPNVASLYSWRVDPRNAHGTTTGDEWSFLTSLFCPPWFITRNFTTGALVAPADYDPDTDYITGENFMTSVRRLVAAAKDAIYYEEIL